MIQLCGKSWSLGVRKILVLILILLPSCHVTWRIYLIDFWFFFVFTLALVPQSILKIPLFAVSLQPFHVLAWSSLMHSVCNDLPQTNTGLTSSPSLGVCLNLTFSSRPPLMTIFNTETWSHPTPSCYSKCSCISF